ncbi:MULTISPECIES: YitT family protein [Congzhengia]|uniref:YitT family protein n=1 Tax=Congzhengia minquanensis TaxID=2763657 RepID=A0A926DLB7_9FIRM|nr:YitT family protein [Congzhengia minquanensis]MBC8541058.1 YitT family protein [Congzhengia minquanensis]
MKLKKTVRTIKIYAAITAGVFLASLGINLFLAPHAIVSGGASGIAILVNRLTGFPMGTFMLLINIPLFILGSIFLGHGFGIRSIYGTILFSVFTDVTALLPGLTENLIMASVFGGALLGMGFGIVFLAGATSGGTDILASLGHKAIPAVDVGKWIFIIDIVIISSGAYLFRNTELVLAGILTLFINSLLVDYIISGANVAKIVYIISDKSEEIAKEIMEKVERGVTGIYTRGMYIKEDRTMLMCVVKRFELIRLERIVERHDKRAFLVYSQARQVTGEGFKIYPIH